MFVVSFCWHSESPLGMKECGRILICICIGTQHHQRCY